MGKSLVTILRAWGLIIRNKADVVYTKLRSMLISGVC